MMLMIGMTIGMRAFTVVPTSWNAGIRAADSALTIGPMAGTIAASKSLMSGPRTANRADSTGPRAWMTGISAAPSCSMIGASSSAS